MGLQTPATSFWHRSTLHGRPATSRRFFLTPRILRRRSPSPPVQLLRPGLDLGRCSTPQAPASGAGVARGN
eukprot:356968-Chlamydomonas_euryale.AAC.39